MVALSFNVDGIEIVAELDAPEFSALLSRIGLKYRNAGPSSPQPSIVVRRRVDGGEGYRVEGSAFAQGFTCPCPADAASAVVAGLVGSYGQRHPSNFCFHGAAVEIQGSTFLIPAVYRAGKSGLVMAVRKLGCTVLSDDAVIYVPENNELKSFGMPIRLRADFTGVCSRELRSYIEANTLHAGKRYVFVDGQTAGHSRQLAGFLFLQRNGTTPPLLSRIGADRALVHVICHNLARSAPPGDILARFAELIETLPCMLLEYDNAEAAAEYLWQMPLTDLPRAGAGQVTSGNGLQSEAHLTIREGPEETVIADDHTGRIYRLNNSAYVMWKVACHSGDMAEAMELLTALYPDRGADELSRDFLAVVERFKSSQLIDQSIFARPTQS